MTNATEIEYRRWARTNGYMARNRHGTNRSRYRQTGNSRRELARAAHYDWNARINISYQKRGPNGPTFKYHSDRLDTLAGRARAAQRY